MNTTQIVLLVIYFMISCFLTGLRLADIFEGYTSLDNRLMRVTMALLSLLVFLVGSPIIYLFGQ